MTVRSPPLLEASHVSKTFTRGGLLSGRRVDAVRDVTFTVAEGGKAEIFAIIGESGSGKTTLARMILGIHRPTSGLLALEGQPIANRRAAERRAFMSRVQPIFQNPFEAFNPLKPLDRYLFTTAERFGGVKAGAGREAACDGALGKVGLSLAEVCGRYPHEMSGGQLQRVAIARALVSNPRLVVADEPVSMVDASLRMAIVTVFGRLRDELGISIVYITHDLATAYTIADRLIILKGGEIVEAGNARDVLSSPRHPYSRSLRDAVLTPDSIGLFGPRKEVP